MKAPALASMLAAALLSALASPAFAEKADRDKPTQIEANRMSADDVRRVNIFEGSVVLTKGTITVRADRIVVRQDPEGFQISVATGKPVRFRQKQEPKGDQEGQWMEGEALRIEIDDRNEKVELFDQAWVQRGGDEVKGDYIFIDQRTDFFSVKSAGSGAPAGSTGRVRAVIQPRGKPEPPAAPSPPGSATPGK
ncbi:MAG: lipopolysaccharide transport periplasmic protein LptA [Burkholderiales bacterium]